MGIKVLGRFVAAAYLMGMVSISIAEEPKAPAEDPMMAAMMKAMTPGPEHATLAKSAGKWKIKNTSWMNPGAPPEVSESTAERKMILGGRYLEDFTQGTFGGMEFEGRGITGFDNVDKKYYSIWVDNFGTGIITMIGTCEEARKTCTFKGTYNNPVSGKPETMRLVETWADDDHYAMTFHSPGPDGKETVTMKMEGVRVP